jgi:hypothetical protein
VRRCKSTGGEVSAQVSSMHFLLCLCRQAAVEYPPGFEEFCFNTLENLLRGRFYSVRDV